MSLYYLTFSDFYLSQINNTEKHMSTTRKILTVIGARPQFIKAAVISRALKNQNDFIEVMVHTGQHFDSNMSDIFFEELSIPIPKYHLGIDSISHGAMTGRMLEEIEKIIIAENPEYVLVYGDTNSTLAGALAARKLHKKLVHVEAGLRSFDMKMPEEINRILTDRISNVLFCPTQTAVTNLENEGFRRFNCKIINSGDVMFDAVLFYREKVKQMPNIAEKFAFLPESFALCTIHRAENTDDKNKLKNIFAALDVIHQETSVILPLHPRTRKLLSNYKIETSVHLIEPVGYLEMLYLLENCRIVLTDSGGLQKEAFFLKKICLTLRDSTEWVELIENKVNFLVGSDKQLIIENYRKSLSTTANFSAQLYGKGNAGKMVVANL